MSGRRKQSSRGSDARWVAGKRAVVELLEAAPGSIRRLYLANQRTKGGKRDAGSESQDLIARARQHSIAVVSATAADLSELVGSGVRHQGVVAETRPYRYSDRAEIFERAAASGRPPLIVALDGVTDPHNLGAIARSAHLLGAHGLLIPKNRAAEVTPTVTRTSAGAVEHLAVAQVTNMARELGELKRDGVWIYAVAASRDAVAAFDADFAGPICLVLGSEGAGIRSLVRKQADIAVEIPMRTDDIGSFNVSVAAALVLYEVDRQRRFAPG